MSVELQFHHITKLFSALDRREPRCPSKPVETIKRWFFEHRDLIQLNPRATLALLSTLLPNLRPDRVYGFGSEKLASELTKALFLEATVRGDRLKEGRKSAYELAQGVSRAIWVTEDEKIWDSQTSLTVNEFDAMLNILASRCVFSAKNLRDKSKESIPVHQILRPVFLKLKANDASWAVLIILKAMDCLKLPESDVLSSYHWLLPQLYQVHDNLPQACRRLYSPELWSFPLQLPKEGNNYKAQALRCIKPEVGTKVGRAEFIKAQSCEQAIKHCGGRKILMERKYDGEYCQVHIELIKNCISIRFFSKSGKESTLDRKDLKQIICSAFKIRDPTKRRFKKKLILEGEMIVYNDRTNSIQPFDHIRRHVTRSGVRIGTANDPPPETDSHLCLVLFDILLHDDKSLIFNVPLSLRRERLSRVLVAPRNGYCCLGTSYTLDFSADHNTAGKELREHFARGIRKRWEGFILKPLESPYFNTEVNRMDKSAKGYGFWSNNPGAWVKLKKDYIKGLGDTLDFAAVGARSCPTRAIKLGHEEGDWNIFLVSVITNKKEVREQGLKAAMLPVFEVSYSISKRDIQLANIQRTIDVRDYWGTGYRSLGHISRTELSKLPYTLLPTQPGHDFPMPEVIFEQPIVFEVTGGGFDKQTNCDFYTPRHPRVSKVQWGRDFIETTSWEEMEEAAAFAMKRGDSQEERGWRERLGSSTSKRRVDSPERRSQSPSKKRKIMPIDSISSGSSATAAKSATSHSKDHEEVIPKKCSEYSPPVSPNSPVSTDSCVVPPLFKARLVEDNLPPASHLSASSEIRGILKNPHMNGKKTQRRAILDTPLSMVRVYVKNEWTSYDVPFDHPVNDPGPWVKSSAQSGLKKGKFERGERRFTVEEEGEKVAIKEVVWSNPRRKYGRGNLPDGDHYDDGGYRICPPGLIPRTKIARATAGLDERCQHPFEYGEFRSRYNSPRDSAPPNISIPTTEYHPHTQTFGPPATFSQPMAANHWITPRPDTSLPSFHLGTPDSTSPQPESTKSNQWMPPRPSTPIYPPIRLRTPEPESPGRTATPASFTRCPERPFEPPLRVGTPYPRSRSAPPGSQISDPSISSSQKYQAIPTSPIKGSYIYLPATFLKFDSLIESLTTQNCAMIKDFSEEVIQQELKELAAVMKAEKEKKREVACDNQLQGEQQQQQTYGIPIDPMMMDLDGPAADPMLMDLDGHGDGGTRPSTPSVDRPSFDQRRIILVDRNTPKIVKMVTLMLKKLGSKIQGGNRTGVLFEIWDKKVVDAEEGKWYRELVCEGWLPVGES